MESNTSSALPFRQTQTKGYPDANAASYRQSDLALSQIKAEIISCRLAPGARFSEAEISAHLGLNRAAARVALTRLSEMQLVEAIPRHGFMVVPITVPYVRDLFELRMMLEPKAALLASPRIEVQRLREINQAPQMAKTQTEQLEFVDSNRAFHLEIAAATGNARLLGLLSALADEMERLVHVGLFGSDENDKERAVADSHHIELIAAFERRDGKAAERITKRHIEHAQALVMANILDQRPALKKF